MGIRDTMRELAYVSARDKRQRNLYEWHLERVRTQERARERSRRGEHSQLRAERERRRTLALAYDGPAMVRGAGERRDECIRYHECLMRFCDAHCQRADVEGHCPDGCAGYQAGVVEPMSPWRDSVLSSAIGGGGDEE